MTTASNGTQNRPIGPTAIGICQRAVHVCTNNRGPLRYSSSRNSDPKQHDYTLLAERQYTPAR